MPQPTFQRVEQLFHEAVQLPPEGRGVFLDKACTGDRELRSAVEELLRHDETTHATDGFLVSPVTEAVEQFRPTHPAPPAPTTIERPNIPGYEILDDLGRGGMGVVFKARQVSLNRIVALKILQPHALITPEQFARFRSEAELLARIHQPNIVTIFDIGEHEGRPYFTMEYVDGPNLAQFLAGRPQDPKAAAQLIETLANAIQVVHDCGIIHRDLKPANVLVGGGQWAVGSKIPDLLLTAHYPPPTLKITDFGLAKDWTAGRDLTQTGMAMGTPNYMAPEQARCRPSEVGPAADIYALGAMLYELLTGRPPFDAATPAEAIALLLREDPLPPSRLRAGLPRDLTVICLKCLEKAPRQRYGTASALAEDLRRFQSNEPIRARPMGTIERSLRWCRRRPLVAALASLLMVLSFAFVVTVLNYNRRLAEAIEQQRQQIIQLNIHLGDTELSHGDNFAALLRFVEALRLVERDTEQERSHRTRISNAFQQSPHLAQHWHLERPTLCARRVNSGLWVASVAPDGTLEVRDVIADTAIGSPIRMPDPPRLGSLSSDGRWLATVAVDGRVTIWDLRSGALTKHELPAATAARQVGFDFPGALLMVVHADAATRYWDMASGRPVLSYQKCNSSVMSDDGQWRLALDPDKRGELNELHGNQATGKVPLPENLQRMVLSRQAERMATVDRDREVRVTRLGASESSLLAHNYSGDISQLRFSPDGQRLLLADDTGTIRVWDAVTACPVCPQLCHPGALAYAEFDASGQELITVCRSGDIRIWHLGRTHRIEHLKLDQLQSLVELLADRRIDSQQECVVLSQERRRAVAQQGKAILGR